MLMSYPNVNKVITREDAMYEDARRMWNRAIEKYPYAIAFCKTKEEIANCIQWATQNSVPIRIRSGRHHYDGFSTGNEVLVIDVSEMNTITIDEEKGYVTVAAGVRNRELYEELGACGYPFPGGGCPTVGVVGFALGGGWGFSARNYGLGCDSIVAIEMMDYTGQVLAVSEEEHRDLFWGLRGSGGAQFGVVLSITFKLPKKQSHAVLLRLEYENLTPKQQAIIFEKFQSELPTMPQEVNFKLGLYNSKEKGVGALLLGICYGDIQMGHDVLAPFLALGQRMKVLVEPMTVAAVNRWIQDAHPDYENYKSSGRFVRHGLTPDQVEELLEGIQVRAEGSTYAAISFYGMGGKMRQVPAEKTSFFYRDSNYIVGFQTVWEDNTYKEANQKWFLPRFKAIEAITDGSFVNFPCEEITNYKKAYYGDNSKSLEVIRKKYDPKGIFVFEQGL